MIHFTPFSEGEFIKYKQLCAINFPNGFDPECTGYIPGVLKALERLEDNEKEHGAYKELHHMIFHQLTKLRSALENVHTRRDAYTLHTALFRITTFGHESITIPERILLEDAGFCYHDRMTQETKCVYPKKVMLEKLNGHMKSVSSIVRSFDIGAALEFEFMIKGQQYGLKGTCMTTEKTLHIPPANKIWIQPNYGRVPDDCENLSGC